MPMGGQYVKNSFTERGGWWYWRRGTTACRIRPVLEYSRIWKELKSIGKTFKYLSLNPSTSVDPYFNISRSSCRSVDCIADTFPRFYSAIGGHSETMKAGCCLFWIHIFSVPLISLITIKPGESPSELQRSRLIRLTRLLSSHSPCVDDTIVLLTNSQLLGSLVRPWHGE